MSNQGYLEAGYLSKKAAENVAFFNLRFAKLRRFYEELNLYGCEIRKRLKSPKGEKIRSIFAICIWNRILDAYQCALLLLERGAGDEAKGHLRSILESLFILEANVKKKTFAKRYIVNHDRQEIRKANSKALDASRVAIQLGKKQFLTKEQRTRMTKLVKSLDKEIKKRKAMRVTKDKRKRNTQSVYGARENARAAGAGMVFEYNKSYAHLCAYTHTSVSGNLEKYIRNDLDVTAVNFVVGPSYDDAHITLILAMEYLLIALFSLNKFFTLGERVILEKYRETLDEYDKLAENMPPTPSKFTKLA